jgi:hypothetical protein
MKSDCSKRIAVCLILLALLAPHGIAATRASLLIPSPSVTDTDNDGVRNVDELAGDTDNDGLPNSNDPDDDGDGVLTAYEDTNADGNFFADNTDGDAAPDYLDADDDGDRVPTYTETSGGTDRFRDTDSDSRRDYRDDDDDGDDIPTVWETDNGNDINRDTDGDDIPDYLDAEATPVTADLTAISISAGALYPAFNPSITAYTLNPVIADGVSDVTVTAQPDNNGSPAMQVSINNGFFIPLNSGQPSSPLQLTGCANVVTVRVTNGPSAKDYTIDITRANCTQGPQGPQGETGTTGPEGQQGQQGIQGPAGIFGLQHVIGIRVSVLRGSSGVATATCPTGKVVIGGGFATDVPPGGSARPESMIVFSSVSNGSTGWSVNGANTTSRNGGDTTLNLTAYAVCAVVAP